MPMSQAMQSVLNVGGGDKTIPVPPYYDGWRHDLLDINPAYHPDICLDARQLQTLPASTYDAVYCSHNLEHYHRHECDIVLKGFHHVLKPDGFAEIRVPNLAAAVRAMVEQGLDIDDVLYASAAGPILVRDLIYGFHSNIEKTGQEHYLHKTGFTARSLGRLLNANGFPHIAVRPLSAFTLVAHAFKQSPTTSQAAMLGISVHQ
jgi:SAM-dependent methyltransferase